MPLRTKFRSAANVRQCKKAAALDQESNKDAELWSHGNSMPAIGGHNCWVTTPREYIAATHKKHWNSRPIFRRIPKLGIGVIRGVKWNTLRCPESAFPSLR